MISQAELDRILGAFLAIGSDELADRVIDAALDEIDRTRERPILRLPRGLRTTPMPLRLAAVVVAGVLVVGGTLYLSRRDEPGVVGPRPTPSVSVGPSPSLATRSPSDLPKSDTQVALSGPMGVGRQIHTATRLDDGQVLIAGGYAYGDGSLASATRYDLALDAFRPTGALSAARGTATATLLGDGRVLIAGGGPTAWNHPDPFLASAELYDPEAGTFAPVGSMATPREAHTATLLADGRVLIAGGNDRNGHAVRSAEVFDPATGTFSATGSMTSARGYHTATRLADGRVLLAGGGSDYTNLRFLSSAELFDPRTGTFSATGSMAETRTYHTATVLTDGRVLVTGGYGVQAPLASAEIYDPTTSTFTSAGSGG